jgi:glycosyltransferase involved in cell wall biosynthesis
LWFLPYSFLRAFFLARRHNIRHIHLCDAVLSPIGIFLKFLTDARLSISIHGLDITYRHPVYQWLIPRCVARYDRIVCVSRATLKECLQRRVPVDKCRVIPNGIHPDEIYMAGSRNEIRAKLEQRIGISVQDKKILLTVGRLVKRKGVDWFVSRVMPHLDNAYCYLIVGNGPEYHRVRQTIGSRGLQGRVFLLGAVGQEERNLILNGSDIFIMPNLTIPGDIEGFGIAALEAGSCGLPVIATDTQGIRDAVIDGKTGLLVSEKDVNGFVQAIQNINLSRAAIRAIVNATFSWPHIYRRYRDALS